MFERLRPVCATLGLALATAACHSGGPEATSAPAPATANPRASSAPTPAQAPTAESSAPEPDAIEHAGLVIDIPTSGDVKVDGAVVSLDSLPQKLAAAGDKSTVVLRAQSDATYERLIHVLDAIRTAGHPGFVLAAQESPTRRSAPVHFPRANEFPPPAPLSPGNADADTPPIEPLISIDITRDEKHHVGGRPVTGPLREAIRAAGANGARRVVIRADRDVRFQVILDTVLASQAESARIAFAITVGPAQPPSGATANVVPRAGPPLASLPALRGTFPACAFPAEADRAAIDSAVVTLKIGVDARGRVTNVAVLSDPGHGFATTAEQCARKASFDPARDASGRAAASYVVMRVRFQR